MWNKESRAWEEPPGTEVAPYDPEEVARRAALRGERPAVDYYDVLEGEVGLVGGDGVLREWSSKNHPNQPTQPITHKPQSPATPTPPPSSASTTSSRGSGGCRGGGLLTMGHQTSTMRMVPPCSLDRNLTS